MLFRSNSLSLRDSSRAALAAAEAELIAAKDDLKHCSVVAPISGRIGSTAKTKGNYVKAGGDPLVSIVQLAPIRVRFSISNREVLDVFGGDVAARRDAAEMSVSLANGSPLGEKGVIEYAENAADSFTDTLLSLFFLVFPFLLLLHVLFLFFLCHILHFLHLLL